MAKQNHQKEKAKALFLTGQYEQKEIADLVGVSANTVSAWKNAEKWEDQKTSLLTTRQNQLHRLYKLLKVLNDDVELKADEGTPINSKEADALLKLTQAIKNLELECSIADKVEVGTEFINMVKTDDPELAKTITRWFDVFLQKAIK
jgi:transcriptional regulator with XRE-family HTH domain